ncbi:hypothetical protein [Streptomyces atratus]|uniref:hypothetical protein n=1 Tax=Streptomyces atratus TaxID=1893 RepID=UPI0021A7E147|nr:hypothetical protein [Streptomyces atratus]MCT2542134.1 hypothetical protein [Streptomyces atratus]
MVTAESARPSHNGPVALARGFLTGGVVGASLAALVVGTVIESVPVVVAGLGLPAVYALLFFLARMPRRAREAAVVPCTALAKIESLRATGGESADIPVRFVLSVDPDDAPAHRVETTADINLVDLPDYRPGGTVVVEYPPDRPWRVRLVQRPAPQWRSRAESARIDSAPESTLVQQPPEGCAFGIAWLLGLLLGAGAVILLFLPDPFGGDSSASSPPSSKPSAAASSATSGTVTSSSGLGTITLGRDRSMLDRGELRRSVATLTKGRAASPAITLVVQERMMSVVFTPAEVRAPGFQLHSLPYERIPALVENARTTLGIDSPQSWQLTADRITGNLTIRITVTGPDSTASLEADGAGKVLRRSPAP